MELVVIIVMFLVIFSVMLKMTALPLWGRVIIGVVFASFIIYSLDSATNQSKTQIAAWLQNPELMLDMAVLLTIDVFLQVSYCITGAKRISGEPMTRSEKIISVVTLWIPGILIFPTLFAMLVEALFSFPGTDFATIAWSLAAGIFIVMVGVSSFLKFCIPESDLRLELIFMINALIALLGVVATVNGRTAVAGTNEVEWLPLLTIILILLAGATCGFLISKRKLKIKN